MAADKLWYRTLSMDAWQGAVRRLFPASRVDSDDYELLLPAESSLPSRRGSPTGNGRHSPLRRRSARGLCLSCLHLITLRRFLIFLAFVPFLLALGVLWSGIPPTYDSIYEFERRLPQHNLSLPPPEGKDGMYLRFPGHIWGHGLNNVLQEIILMSQLAYLSNRSYVFEQYTWSHIPLPYTIYDFALRPARIPLNAFISGPSAGGPMTPPRAVSSEFWEQACPEERRVVLSSKDAPAKAEGSVIMDWWVEKLNGITAGCVEVDNSPPVFDPFLFGSSRLLSIWPKLSQSPIITDYAWSPLVQSGISRNFALLQPHARQAPSLSASHPSAIPGLVAVHLRRGDYVRHCPRLATWGATYMGFNQFAAFPDRFEPPPFESFEGRSDYYSAHCWPSVEQVVATLANVRRAHPGLRRVYVLTNGWVWWVNGLRDALRADGWEDLKSSLDVKLDAEQSWVAMAVDMAIAERAEVFVGNGFSSLTSNVNMLRVAKGMDPKTSRFL